MDGQAVRDAPGGFGTPAALGRSQMRATLRKAPEERHQTRYDEA
jgi:hypothetical protein